jgi:hypothetical protein
MSLIGTIHFLEPPKDPLWSQAVSSSLVRKFQKAPLIHPIQILCTQFKSCAHDPCIFVGYRPKYHNDPIYVGCYVNFFIYFSTDCQVEEWFEAYLASRISVGFMGPVCWFLRIYFLWETSANGMWVHLSQAGFVQALLLKYKLDRANAVKTPYRSGLCIDCIPKPPVDSLLDLAFLQEYQSLMGCITGLFTSTRSDLGVSMKLLSTHTHRPSPGHLEARKHVLFYLKGSSERGILYQSVGLSTGTSDLTGVVSYLFCNHEDPIGFCDLNWGPQDASHPMEEPDDVLNVEESQSLQGAHIVRMGGAVAWKEMREKRVSRATCKAEIKSLDECTCLVQALRLLLEDLSMSDVAKLTLIYNDNQGSVDWSKGWANRRRMRHMNIQNIAVRDAREHQEIDIQHIEGELNPADILTKEHGSGEKFISLCDVIVPLPPDGGCENPSKTVKTG